MVAYIFYSQYRIYSDNYIQANEKFPLGSAAPHNDRLYTAQFLSQRRYLHIRDAAQVLLAVNRHQIIENRVHPQRIVFIL